MIGHDDRLTVRWKWNQAPNMEYLFQIKDQLVWNIFFRLKTSYQSILEKIDIDLYHISVDLSL